VIISYLADGSGAALPIALIGLDRRRWIMSRAAILQALMRCWPTDN